MLDAYTIKKIAPRLLVAIIGINISIYLCAAAIDITNIIGGGISELIRGPFLKDDSFKDLGIDGNAISGTVGVVGIGGALVGMVGGFLGAAAVVTEIGILGSIGLLMIALMPIILIAIAILATLVLRYGAIIFLTLISPIAIACWVLPGTEKYFKQWWDIFLKVLIMYPIIAAIFAMSDVLCAIFLKTQGETSNVLATVGVFVILFVLYAPLFMIPFAFKMAGGVLGQLYDFANGKVGQGINSRLGKWKENPNSWYGAQKNRADMTRRARGLTPGQQLAGLSHGLRSRREGGSFRAGRRGALQSSRKVYEDSMKALEENEAVKGIGKDDDIWHATKMLAQGATLEQAREHLMTRAGGRFNTADGGSHVGLEEALAMASTTRDQLGSKAAGSAAIRQIAQTTTGWKDSIEMVNDINAVAGEDRQLASRLLADAMEGQKGVGRIDNAGFSYSTGVKQLERMAEGPEHGMEREALEMDVQRDLFKSMANKQSASTVATMDHRGMQVTAPYLLDELNTAMQSGNSVSIQRAAAKLANMYDVMQYTQPENAEFLADMMTGSVISQDGETGEPITPRKVIERMRGNPEAYEEFANMRRDFRQSEAERVRVEGAGGTPTGTGFGG